jgi:hypothetical protein
VIRHNDEIMQYRVGKMCRDIHPTFVCNLSRFIQNHNPIVNETEPRYSVAFRANCDKILPFRGIIKPLQTDTASVMRLPFIFHLCLLSLYRSRIQKVIQCWSVFFVLHVTCFVFRDMRRVPGGKSGQLFSNSCVFNIIKWYEPQGKPWTLFLQQAAGNEPSIPTPPRY